MRDTVVDKEEFIGGYKLRNLLATGQSSQVWEVIETSSGRHLAMKLLLPEATRDGDHKRLLFHEAEVGLKLVHPNIIKIVAVSKEKDPKNFWFVMEFFPAGSMKVRIVNKQMDFIKEHAQKVFKQSATALAYLHGSGWIHRDVKPDNILVNSAGEAKLIDFAIAQRKGKSSFFAKLFRKKGKVSGTRSYMSPEQIRGEDLDERADVYSFGATLYEIVTGRPPFRGASSLDLLNKHLYEKVLPPLSLNAELTEDFSALVARMLAKKQEERPANFHEILMQFKTLRVFKDPAAVAKGKKP
ncbi:MAG: serine/threonine protein kinase [Gemmataceae bacterium]|nr:serine/threonine protein kinase [Gemmataceae bacterium]